TPGLGLNGAVRGRRIIVPAARPREHTNPAVEAVPFAETCPSRAESRRLLELAAGFFLHRPSLLARLEEDCAQGRQSEVERVTPAMHGDGRRAHAAEVAVPAAAV